MTDFYEKLSQQPVSEVSGVVGPAVIALTGNKGNELWDLSFDLVAWKDHEGKFYNEKLSISKRGTQTELDEIRDELGAYQIVRMLVRIGKVETVDYLMAVFCTLIDSQSSDPDLQNVAEELQKTVILRTNRFGELTLNRSVGWFEGIVSFGAREIPISIEPENTESYSGVIQIAEKLWDEIRDWDKRARDYAVVELLSVKNKSWLEKGELTITPEEFRKRMKLESVSIFESGNFELSYEDGDLFWGHYIVVEGNVERGFTDSSIYG